MELSLACFAHLSGTGGPSISIFITDNGGCGCLYSSGLEIKNVGGVRLMCMLL